ncbi:MAG: saccharopine dehydrogenase NADP-binding domain-containing protein [Halioglobus sp.]
MSKQRELGIVVYGATGYTGKLVAEYLNKQYGVMGDVPWAIAGRSLEKLEAVRDELGLGSDLPLVLADASNPASITSLAERAQVILTTVGPYQLYGSDLVAACALAGTDYVDLCGEPAWMKEMISEHADAAKASGARIVFSCGFDSIPFDLGVFYLQQASQNTLGSVSPRVRGRVRSMKGTWSGGTLASFKATMAAAAKDPELLSALIDPFALTPAFQGPEQPDGMKPLLDEVLKSWVAPFIMATINTKNIHRSNQLMGHLYGEDFRYDEMLVTGPGEQGEAIAKAVASDKSMASDPTQPGEGPSREERESGYYDLLFIGEAPNDQIIRASVKGDMDPGYGSTSKMIVETAVCLLQNPQAATGGIWTPAAALGSLLIDRLQENAGISFELEVD